MSLRVLLAVSLWAALPANSAETIAPAAPQFLALSVPDARASARWYSEAFGLRQLGEIKPPDGAAHLILLTSDSLLVEILQLRDARSPGAEAIEKPQLTQGIFKVGFHVRDLEAAVAKLRAMDARFETGIVDDARHSLRFVLVRDPDGNFIQVFGGAK
jgi:catechol 2,3-dioxygenase-like lactoylglutathione lyase family enzyme